MQLTVMAPTAPIKMGRLVTHRTAEADRDGARKEGEENYVSLVVHPWRKKVL